MARRGRHGTTRRGIIEALRREGPLTAGQLADRFAISSAAIRQHLAQLQEDGLVEACGSLPSSGRPRQLYVLTAAVEQVLPNGYERLALDLLLCAAQGQAGSIDEFFAARQELLAERYGPQLAGLPLEQRVEQLAYLLTEQGYMAEYSTLDDGSLALVQHHCPIGQVASAYSQACRCERSLYEGLLEAEVVSESTIAGGARCCRYKIAR